MSERRSSRLIWLALPGCFLVALTGLFVPMPFHGRMPGAIGDMAHAPLFAGLTLLTLVLLQTLRPLVTGSFPWRRRILLTVVSLFALGVLVEMVQGMIGRSAAVHDAISNGLGIIAAAAWFIAGGLESSKARRALQLLGVLLLTSSWIGPLQVIRDCFRVHSEFPRIASFETRMEITRWHFNRCRRSQTTEDVTDGKFALRWLPQDAPHPAMTLLEVAPDWTSVDTLELDLVLRLKTPVPDPDRTWEIIVKVMDENHQDYHNDVAKHYVTLRANEPQHVVFPSSEMLNGPNDRQLDLSRIKMVSLLIDRPGPGVEVMVDHIHATLQSD
ncbi:antibiotic resistance protein VanZ [Rhodopirellula halodulae]|uniref:antibiotic resistance protein VanZ n=1 Tax=Rhodopirellula halodulae TaxID=2894198 RepID=UPI001E2C152C|nr:antibiotic resistance protein VanZ [Rhodopirellula sp. JC737]MCC9655729.1 antibiotic resistance protein VanZ [Rhodopirellula sp. JC737]